MAAFLIFWFALTLAPAVIVAPMVLQHDRYLHIPSFAFCALVAWAILYLGKSAGGRAARGRGALRGGPMVRADLA